MARAGSRDLLAEYKAKRDFGKTPEPGPKRAKAKGNSFVIQKHAARRTHFDFRLEHDGVLKSWAVTKGPSLDPADKRLAMQTEDHPVEYGGFEGVIPKGEYGGGTVLLWDQGTWEPIGDPREGLRKGKLEFLLHGKKLRGSWTLVRIRGRDAREGGKTWLLMKHRDVEVRPASEYDITEDRPESVATGRAMDEIAGKTNVRLRFVGYTNNERLERRTALVYGDDIGLSTARARRAKEQIQEELSLPDEQAEHEGRGYVQSEDVVNAGFVQGETSYVVAQVVYDELAVLDDYEGVEITPIYGVRGREDDFIPFLSPRWIDVFLHTLKEAKRLGLGVDQDVQGLDGREPQDLVVVDLLKLLVAELLLGDGALHRLEQQDLVGQPLEIGAREVELLELGVDRVGGELLVEVRDDVIDLGRLDRDVVRLGVVRDERALDHVAEREPVAHGFLRVTLGRRPAAFLLVQRGEEREQLRVLGELLIGDVGLADGGGRRRAGAAGREERGGDHGHGDEAERSGVHDAPVYGLVCARPAPTHERHAGSGAGHGTREHPVPRRRLEQPAFHERHEIRAEDALGNEIQRL